MERVLVCTFPEDLAGPQRFLSGLLDSAEFKRRFSATLWHVPDRYRRLRGKLRLFRDVRAQLRQSGAQVVYLNLDLSLAFWLCIGFRLAGARRIVSRALNSSYSSPANPLARWVYRTGMGWLAHQKLAISPEAARAMYAGGPGPVVLIPCLIDFQSLHRDAAGGPVRSRPAGERFVFGCVGRLMAQKNQALAIRALAPLRRQGLEVELRLVGEGPDRAALQALAQAEGVAEAVVFAGTDDNIGAVYRGQLDALLVPSLYEGQGRIVAEAQSFGLPMALSAQVPAMAVLDGTGVIAGLPLEVEAWSAALRQLMRMPRGAARPMQELDRHRLSLAHGVALFCDALSGRTPAADGATGQATGKTQ